MGWAIGTGENGRDIGYGVPALYDYPGCEKEIDRGMSFCCGEYTTEEGCGLYFCGSHLMTTESGIDEDKYSPQLCDSCAIYWKLRQIDDDIAYKLAPEGYEPKPDILKWVIWKLYDQSWAQWRKENPEEVKKMQERRADEIKKNRNFVLSLHAELEPDMEQNKKED